MDERAIADWRLDSVGLSEPRFTAVEQVVGWLGAVQSQDYGPAKWSLGQRVGGGLRDADVDQAFAEGRILRTHVLRPTWHFVLPADIRWLLALTGPRVHATNAYMYRQTGLDPGLLERCTALLVAALEGGSQLTRKEVQDVLAREGIAADGFRLGYILMHAELEGVVCSGALRGRQHTYALLDQRAPHGPMLSRDEALAELTLRYFTSHGPATAKDFRWWSSLTLTDIRAGLETVAPQLERLVVDGRTYWSAPRTAPPPPPSPTVHLLQGYDEYVVAFAESKYVVDVTGTARVLTGERPVFNLLVILDGQVAGHWKRTLAKGAVLIEVALYAPLDDAQRSALQAAADRHAAFLDLTATVVTTQL